MSVLWTIAWKEWLGLRGKLAALIAIPAGFIPLATAYDAAALQSSHVMFVMGYCLIAPIFLAMHAAAEDQSAGNLEFVRGLPVPLGQLGLVRVFAALAALLVPLVVTGGFVYGLATLLTWWKPDAHFWWMDPRGEPVPWFISITAIGMAVSASLFLWTTALAMNQSSELRAGLIGVATAVVWGAWTFFSFMAWTVGLEIWWTHAVAALGPFAVVILFDSRLSVGGRIALGIVELAGMCLLMAIAARRYGTLEPPRWKSGMRLSNPSQALWWLQWRQAWPLALAGLATIVALSSVGMLNARDPFTHSFLYASSIIIGDAWAIVIGATMFTAELEPHLAAFWRSRPIDPSTWFRIKYLTGALAILIFIDLPAAWLGRPLDASSIVNSVSYLACVPALHLAVFSLAVLVACLVRHTIYAGILSLAAMLFVIVLPMAVSDQGLLAAINIEVVMHRLTSSLSKGRIDLWLLSLAIYLAFTLSVAAAATLVAGWAVRKDIGVRA